MRFTAALFNKKILLGRPSNNLTSGIVGLANVGKSTFFQAITKSTLGNPANYPFATIQPEEAKCIVPSTKLANLQKLYQSEKTVPATLTIYDIAGLIRGACNGEGLGNQFLNDIRHVDGIYQVVRGFVDEDITHIEGNVDPVRDCSLVQDELILKDLDILENLVEKLDKKKVKASKNSVEYKELEFELDFLKRLEEHLYNGMKIYHLKDVMEGEKSEQWTDQEVEILNKHNFLTSKPTIFLLNVNPRDYLLQENQFKQKVQEWISKYSPNDHLILFSAELETKYNELGGDTLEFFEYCSSQINSSTKASDAKTTSCLPDIIKQMRKSLKLISFYTCGPIECRQWTIREQSTAPEGAGVIHTDLKKTFINAEVMKYADIETHLIKPQVNDINVLKNIGKLKRVGKAYIIEDGDVCLFKASKGNSR
ncbi:Obg-like ATPase [Hanseniaspora vineae]